MRAEWLRFTDGRSSVKSQRRTYDVATGQRIRSGLWNSWCQLGGRSETPRMFGWSFLRSVWSLLCKVTGGRFGRMQEIRSLWAPTTTGCSAPRSTAIYGRLN